MGLDRVAFAVASGFYVAVERGGAPTLAGRPLAVIRGGKVLDASPELGARGVVPGTKRCNLLELCPEARIITYRPERYEEGQRRFLDLLARHAPAVEPVETAQAFLDVAGLGAAFCERVGRAAWRELGVLVGFGLGPTKLVARAAGLELVRKGVSRPGEVLAVPDGPPRGTAPGLAGPPGEAVRAFLAPLPVGRLYPLPAEVSARLERLGFGTIGEVARLPLGELVRQFGRPLAQRIAVAAAGGEADPVRALWPLPSLRAIRRFEGGLSDREALRAALAEVAEGFSRAMSDRGLACGEVTLSFVSEGGRSKEASRRLTRPGRARATLACVLEGLAERLLDGWAADAPPVEMEARAGRVLPLAGEQLDFGYLFGAGGNREAGGGDAPGAGRESGRGPGVRRATPVSREARETARQLAWRFGDRIAVAREEPASGPFRRRRREELLAFYDPLRAGGRSGD